MNADDLYYEGGEEPLLRSKAVALLLGVDEQAFLDEALRQGQGGFQIPPLWVKNGIRRQREYQEVTGRTDMRGALDYWAART